MDLLQVRIAAVLSVAPPVVLERDDLVRGLVAAHRAVLTVAVLVDVVAEVDDGVDVIAPGEAPVGVEVSVRQARAGHHSEPDRLDTSRRCGPGAPDR